MKFRWDKKYLYWGITAVSVIAVSLFIILLVFRGGSFRYAMAKAVSICMPVLNGLVLAYLFIPILNFFERLIQKRVLHRERQELSVKKRGVLRAVSIILTLITVFTVAYAFFSVILPQIFFSIRSIAAQFPVYVNNLTLWLAKVLEDNPELEAQLGELIDVYTPELRAWMNDSLIPQMNEAIKAVSGYAFSVLKAIWNLILGLIISVYIMASKERFIGQAKKTAYAALSVPHANALIQEVRFIHRTFGGFISGKLLDSLIIGILCFAGTTLIGTPYAILISVIVGVTNIIPFFGPYLGAIPSALLILMINPVQCLYFLIFVLILQQFDGNILGPKILGDSTGLSGFWVIFSITIFGGFLGIPGMVIGVPTFAVLYAFLRRRVNHSLKKKELPTDTGEYVGLEQIREEDLSFVEQENTK